MKRAPLALKRRGDTPVRKITISEHLKEGEATAAAPLVEHTEEGATAATAVEAQDINSTKKRMDAEEDEAEKGVANKIDVATTIMKVGPLMKNT